jgi:hypothetical protein
MLSPAIDSERHLMTTESGYRAVSPCQVVDVYHDGRWFGGKLEARWLDSDHWHGLVKFYGLDGRPQYQWFGRAEVRPGG